MVVTAWQSQARSRLIRPARRIPRPRTTLSPWHRNHLSTPDVSRSGSSSCTLAIFVFARTFAPLLIKRTSMTSPAANSESGLPHQLSAGQMTMVAVGGSIGTGLLLGTAAAIELAGPPVILRFVLAAFLSWIGAFRLCAL